MRALSIDSALFPHVGDAITQLANEWVWEVVGDSVADVVAACKAGVESWYSDMLIGTVFQWMIEPPAGWLLLDGSTYQATDYPELADLLPAHLVDGDEFTLPDINEAFPYGVQDDGDAGVVEGDNVLILSVAQLPSHTHTYTPPVMTVTAETPVVPVPTAGIGSPIATGATGSGDDIDKRPLRFGLVYAVYAGRE
jgi:microcystin-dependent protein